MIKMKFWNIASAIMITIIAITIIKSGITSIVRY